MNSKERSLKMLQGQEVDQIPVFPLLMGFSARKAGLTYREFASNGSRLAEAQIRAAQLFKIDVITACSDAFRIAADLGGEIVYHEETPPHIQKPIITSREDLNRLGKIDVADSRTRCADRAKGIREMDLELGQSHLILGWVDFPFAEACSCCGVQNFMYMLVDEPELAHDVLNFLTKIVIDFALLQLEQGAPMIGCGDAAASLISAPMFSEFALPYEKRVVDAIHKKGGLVKTHICGNTSSIMSAVVKNDSDLFNVDHMVDLHKAVEVYCGANKAIKGNLNPVADILLSTPEHTYEQARKCIEIAGGNRYFLSPGCEIPTSTRDENMHAFCDAAKRR